MLRQAALLVLSLYTTFSFAYPMTPDPHMTTGVLCTSADKDYTYLRYKEQIPYCRRNVSKGHKAAIYAKYGIPEKCRSRYTIDHFIPLSLGGNNSTENLWPEHKLVKATRPNLENELHMEMEKGTITQRQAVEIIAREKMNPPRAFVNTADCDIRD